VGRSTFRLHESKKEGYRATLQQYGIGYDDRLVCDGGFRQEDAFVACKEMLSRAYRPTALFVANNHMLIGVMRAMAELGLKCPQDISTVSIDDFPWADAFSPRLTTVSQRLRKSDGRPFACY
jgi:LacI family transcriptional regulator